MNHSECNKIIIVVKQASAAVKMFRVINYNREVKLNWTKNEMPECFCKLGPAKWNMIGIILFLFKICYTIWLGLQRYVKPKLALVNVSPNLMQLQLALSMKTGCQVAIAEYCE